MLLPDGYYHVFNHANGDENLFREPENYRYFLQQWTKYVEPVAATWAYCLMPNHIHFLVNVRSEGEVSQRFGFSTGTFGKFQTFQKLASKQFANLFSSYTQAYNKKYHRRGSLFIPNFKHQPITHDNYLTDCIIYIHRNPVHHGFAPSMSDWKWSSYTALTGTGDTRVCRTEVIDWFGGLSSFYAAHRTERPGENTAKLFES